jgi:hypothetical protein
MAYEDVVVSLLAGALGGIIVGAFNHLLTSPRWEKEFGTRIEEMNLKKQELEAQYGAGARVQALSEFYESLGVPARADRWPIIRAMLESKLDSAGGHWIPPEVREKIQRIVTETEDQARKLDPDWPDIVTYEKWEQEQMEEDLATAPPEVQAEAQISQLRLNAMLEIKDLVSRTLLEYVERAHPTSAKQDFRGPGVTALDERV